MGGGNSGESSGKAGTRSRRKKDCCSQVAVGGLKENATEMTQLGSAKRKKKEGEMPPPS